MRTLITFLAFALVHPVSAQVLSANDYFNQAARQFVKEDKLSALRTLDKGLRDHPGDTRMLRLAEELLKEDQQQQQQEQQQEQQKQEQQQEQEQQKQDNSKGDQGKEEEQQQDPSQQDKDQQGQKREKQQDQIAPQDAKRILDALERQEKEVQDKVRERLRPTPRTPIDKDW